MFIPNETSLTLLHGYQSFGIKVDIIRCGCFFIDVIALKLLCRSNFMRVY